MKSALLQALPDGRAAYVEVPPPAGLDGPCFIWQGATSRKGYALRGRGLLHRAVYEEVHGPLDRGIQVHHVCQRPGCVNLAHLEAHTQRSHSRQHHPDPAIDAAVALLADYPRLSAAAIARFSGHKPGTVAVALHRAVEEGLVRRVERGEYVLADSNWAKRRPCPHCGYEMTPREAERLGLCTDCYRSAGGPLRVTRLADSNGAKRCECPPWMQTWRPETYWLCETCGLPFPEKGVEARRPMPGDPE